MKYFIFLLNFIIYTNLFSSWGQFTLKDDEKGGCYFNNPYGLAVSPDSEYLYIANTYNNNIWVFHTKGAPIYGVVLYKYGNLGKGDGEFDRPFGIAVDKEGYVYIADTYNHRIQKFDKYLKFIKKWGEKGKENGQFNKPCGIAVDNEGNLYVADTHNHRIQKFDKDGNFIMSFGKKGNGQGEFDTPYKLDIDNEGNIYVADTYNHRIQKFDKNGKFIMSFGNLGDKEGEFNNPVNIVIDKVNNFIYVADANNKRIQKFDLSFKFCGQIKGNLYYPSGLAVDKLGNIYVSDGWYIQKFDSSGKHILQWGTAW